jgi:LysR family transcriptional regulator for metE and metH
VLRIALPRLEIRDLEIVLALASSGSTVKAASSLHITQSAVSRGLLLAEDKLGVRLFDRSSRGLVPTPSGERLIHGAGAALLQLVALENEARVPCAEPIVLRVACECHTAYRWVPSTLARLRKQQSKIEVVLAIEHTEAPLPALLGGALDVALLTTSKGHPSIVQEPLFEDEIVFLLAHDHPLAARASLRVSDLLEHTLITSTQTPKLETRWFQRRVFGRSVPKLANLGFPLTEAIVDAARAGMGIAVLSEWVASPYLEIGDVIVRRLRGQPLHRPWRIAYRREVQDSARALATALRAMAPRLRKEEDASLQASSH